MSTVDEEQKILPFIVCGEDVMKTRKIKAVVKLCRMDEVLLVVPYAGTAAFLSSSSVPNIPRVLILLLAAFAGFSAGNIVNALADQDIDIRNPRTCQRPLVSKELSTKETVLLLCTSMLIVLGATAILDPVYVLMLPIPVAICFAYSFCKRFTWLGHFVLGIAHSVCPIAGWIVFGNWMDWRGMLFGAVIFFWTLSLDMIYSLQDMEYDIKEGLYSIPAMFGERVAYTISIISHIIMLLLLGGVIYILDCGCVFVAIVFIAEFFIIAQYILICVDKKNAKYALSLNQGYTTLLFVASIMNRI